MASIKIAPSRMRLVDAQGMATPEFFRILQALQGRTGGLSGVMDASDVASTPTGDVSATNVQAAIAELASEKASNADLSAHISDATDAHDASAISNVPAGGIAATTVQAALNELDGDKEAAGTAAAAIVAHVALADPHTQYLTAAEGNALYPSGSGTSTGTNTGDQLTFKTIAVSGQSDVVADSTTDTLTLVAGTNVTITTNAGTDSITINASGGGGSGDVVGPASAANNRVVLFDGATGKLIKDSGLTLAGTNTGDQTLAGLGGQPLDADLTSWAGVTRAAGFDTFAATPSSANLRTLVTDETGSGALVFADTPTLIAPVLGTPTSGNLANCTFPTLNQSTTGSAATLTTPRNINGVAFDGSANITVDAAAGTLTGATLAAGVTASSLTSLGTIAALVATTADINGGTVDNATIGATTASTGRFSTIETTGNVRVGGTPSTTANFQISNPITGATTAYGARAQQAVASGVTSAAAVWSTFTSTQAAAFTLTNLRHFQAEQSTIGAGSAVTTQIGFNATSSLTGAATNIGFNSSLVAATGAWNFYAQANANNAYAGLSRFGAVTVPLNTVDITGSLGRGAPVTKTADFTLAATENWLICNKASSCVVTLPAASSWTGREVMIKTITAQTVVSASSNVIPRAGGAAGTAILAAVAGNWATLVSNGTNWEIMAGS